MFDQNDLLELTDEMAAALGVDLGITAYIRPIANGKGLGYALCSHEGEQLAVFPSYEAAFFTARQHNLEPVCVH